MTEPLYSDEAIIRSVTYHGKAGHKISLELDPDGWVRLKGTETTRCMMVLVPIQNDGQPDEDAAQRAATPAADLRNDPGAWKPRRHMADLSRAQQAGILCNDPRFQRFLERIHDIVVTDNDDPAIVAADFVREYCSVDSRARLDSYGPASVRWDQLRSEFDAWRGKIGHPDERAAG